MRTPLQELVGQTPTGTFRNNLLSLIISIGDQVTWHRNVQPTQQISPRLYKRDHFALFENI
jgi:hypothetical protein